MNIITFLDAATSTATSSAIRVNDKRIISGPIPVTISGITTATVVFEGAIATQAEVDAGTANFELMAQGSFTEDAADGILTAFPFIRARISDYTAGTITVRAYI